MANTSSPAFVTLSSWSDQASPLGSSVAKSPSRVLEEGGEPGNRILLGYRYRVTLRPHGKDIQRIKLLWASLYLLENLHILENSPHARIFRRRAPWVNSVHPPARRALAPSPDARRIGGRRQK